MSIHYDDYEGRMPGEDPASHDETGTEPRAYALWVDDELEEARITCRTGSTLSAEPDIVSGKVLTQLSFRSAALDLRLGSKVTFNPGLAPQACVISPDNTQLLPARYVNLLGATLVAQLPGRVLFQVDVQDVNRPGVLAFRLKFEEQRIQPKRAVILAAVDLRSRMVTLTRG